MYQDFGGERELLATLLARIAQSHAEAAQQYAPEFAIGLQAFLDRLGVPSQLVAIGRTTFGAEHHEVSSSPIAHVAVRCFGTDWDAGGADAEKRFTSRWFDFPLERTTFHRNLETVDSLDEQCMLHCAPIEPPALQAIAGALQDAWRELVVPIEADRQDDVFTDIPL
jgi:hypothetical protein